MVNHADSIYSESTIQSADTIESHRYIEGLFALGTYQVDQKKGDLEEEKQDDQVQDSLSTSPEYSRKGSVKLKKISRSEGGEVSCDTLCEIESAAVLDMKWLSSEPSLLSVALADSHVSLFRYKASAQSQSSSMERVQHIEVNAQGALCLSLDWSDRRGGSSQGHNNERGLSPSAIVSQSDGTLAHLSNVLEGSPSIETWKGHDYEAWTCGYDAWSGGDIVWSGGDDLTLKGWDLRSPCIDGQRSSTFEFKKGFEGGVTSMQSHHLRQHLWAVGSYDGGLRLFDARNPRRPLSTTQAGGGIWRIKWHPTKANRLLLGCMHDGFKVMSLDSLLQPDNPFSSDEMSIHTRFDKHESLAYGCDWDYKTSIDTIYSCSFYDATWHLWQCND